MYAMLIVYTLCYLCLGMVKLYLVPVTRKRVNIFLRTPHMDLSLQTTLPHIKAFWFREQVS